MSSSDIYQEKLNKVNRLRIVSGFNKYDKEIEKLYDCELHNKFLDTLIQSLEIKLEHRRISEELGRLEKELFKKETVVIMTPELSEEKRLIYEEKIKKIDNLKPYLKVDGNIFDKKLKKYCAIDDRKLWEKEHNHARLDRLYNHMRIFSDDPTKDFSKDFSKEAYEKRIENIKEYRNKVNTTLHDFFILEYAVIDERELWKNEKCHKILDDIYNDLRRKHVSIKVTDMTKTFCSAIKSLNDWCEKLEK